jgi:hypothetical protein
MGDESEIAELRRRVTLVEQDAEGEKTVSRHILRWLDDIDKAILDLTKAVGQLTKTVVDGQSALAETNKGLGRLEQFVLVSQAETPRKFAEIAAVVMREELAKRK